MSEFEPIDLVALAILGVAALRGLFLGLIREAFSIGALAGAWLVVRALNPLAAPWLAEASEGAIGEAVAPWISGAVLAVAAIAGVGAVGLIVRRGARAVGLGWADRAGGAVLGLAEGALVVVVGLSVLGAVLGRDHELVAHSRSLAALQSLEQATDRDGAEPAVAAPPPG